MVKKAATNLHNVACFAFGFQNCFPCTLCRQIPPSSRRQSNTHTDVGGQISRHPKEFPTVGVGDVHGMLVKELSAASHKHLVSTA